MNAKVGRPKVLDLSALRNRIWAHAVLTHSGLPPHKMAFFYPQTAGGLDSTVFHKTLEIGRPTPRLWLADGSEGPALRLEKEWPGTLEWLLHPLWSAIGLTSLPLLHTVYTYMSALGEAAGISMVQVDESTNEVTRLSSNVDEELEQLASIGTLDSLALVVLRAQEAFIRCQISDHDCIVEFSASKVPAWPCMRWVPIDLRDSLASLVFEVLNELSPAWVPAPCEARQHCLTQTLLMFDNTPSPINDQSILEGLLSRVACPNARP